MATCPIKVNKMDNTTIPTNEVKSGIKQHLDSLSAEYKKYFARPRWDSKHRIMRGSNGYAIRMQIKQLPALDVLETVLYRLDADNYDRDVNHIVITIRQYKTINRIPTGQRR